MWVSEGVPRQGVLQPLSGGNSELLQQCYRRFLLVERRIKWCPANVPCDDDVGAIRAPEEHACLTDLFGEPRFPHYFVWIKPEPCGQVQPFEVRLQLFAGHLIDAHSVMVLARAGRWSELLEKGNSDIFIVERGFKGSSVAVLLHNDVSAIRTPAKSTRLRQL
mgnify:CR=1 FL=1